MRETVKGPKMSFNWASIAGENLELATITETSSGQEKKVNIRLGKGTNYPVLYQVKSGDKLVIDSYSENPEWVHCFTVDDVCNTIDGYIIRSAVSSVDSEFFPLGDLLVCCDFIGCRCSPFWINDDSGRFDRWRLYWLYYSGRTDFRSNLYFLSTA